MTPLFVSESVFVAILLLVALVSVAGNRLRIPYSVVLVVIGLIFTFQSSWKIEISPELILALLVPPLAFEAAFRIELSHLRENLLPILALAVPGVVLTMLVIGSTVSVAASIPFAAAAVFGALISATDPVSVIALFRQLGVPRRLMTLLEGESLLNDGTAIVVFNIALLAAITGHFDPFGGVIDFVRVALGGVLIGTVLGWIVSRLLAHIDDYLVETTLTTCLAFGSYLIADQLRVSGVLAVVCAGLLAGNLGSLGMSPTTRIVVSNFWDYLTFIANSLVFLLIGLVINVSDLVSHLWPIAVAIAAVLLSRAFVVYGLARMLRRTRSAIPMNWQHVLMWGGLRGAICLALALSLPASLTDRDILRAMTFGLVLFTILGQGVAMPFVLKRLGLAQRDDRQFDRDLRLGRLYAAEAAWEHLQKLHDEGLLRGKIWNDLSAKHLAERQELEAEIDQLYSGHAELEHELVLRVRRESLRAERVALADAVQRGLIPDEAFRTLAAEVDKRLDELILETHPVADSARQPGKQ